MTKIVVDDFKLVYKALECKRAKLPVRILRRFRQELYNFTVTNKTTSNLRVAAIEDERVSDEELVMAIGKYSDLGLKGLNGLEADEWYRSIVLNDLDVLADDLLEYAAPRLLKQNSGRLPLHKYLAEAEGEFTYFRNEAKKQNFDTIISNTIRKNRHCVEDYVSVKQVWNNEKTSLDKATRLIAHLPEHKIDVMELELVLNEIFTEDVNILQNPKPSIRTNIRRLITIYDYLKWGKKELPD